jgi:hypothetical protein
MFMNDYELEMMMKEKSEKLEKVTKEAWKGEENRHNNEKKKMFSVHCLLMTLTFIMKRNKYQSSSKTCKEC